MLTYQYIDLAHSRKQANDTRARRMRQAERVCLITLGVAGVQFVVAILTLL